MGPKLKLTALTYAVAAALASCVDPFGDNNGTGGNSGTGGTDGHGGRPTISGSMTSSGMGGVAGPTGAAGSYTSAGQGDSTGIGGAPGRGGNGGNLGGAGGRGGSANTGGSVGSGGAPDGGGGGKVGLDAGKDVGRVDSGSALVPLPCPMNRFYPPLPDGAVATCPPTVTDLNQFLPTTPPVDACTPLPHPGSDCPFYFFSWQNYLIAAQPDAQGKSAFLSWGTIENTFGAGAGTPAPAIPEITAGVTQAGGRQVLIDQNGHAVYYAIHMNPAMVAFVNAQGLTSADAIRNADPMLTFPPGMVETKEAWMIVPDNAPPADFIITKARVPMLHPVVDPFNNTQVTEDRTQLRDVTVALLAIHIVFTVPGHPEFIWSSFQHVDANVVFDVAPTAAQNPDMTPPTTIVSPNNYLLYKGGTAANAANRGIANLMFDTATQSFTGQQTSIYRMFTSSKHQTTDFDGDVGSINDNMTAIFASARLPATDRRGHYRLIGAAWQDRPMVTMTAPNKVLTNDETDPDIAVNGADSLHAIQAGEDRVSSIAMESFTQPTDSFPNCFACHDTRQTTARGVPAARDQAAPVLLQPKLINVSHVFNEVVRLNP